MRGKLLTFTSLLCAVIGWSASARPSQQQHRPLFKLIHVLPTPYDMNCIAFSPDSRQILSGGWDELVGDDYNGTTNTYSDGQMRRWSVASGRLLEEQPTKLPLMAIAYSPDGRLLATGYGSEVRLSSAATGKTVRSMKIDVHSDPTGVEALAFSPDGLTLACGTVVAEDHSEPGPFFLWNVSTGRQYGSRYSGFYQTLDRNGPHRGQWFAVAPASQTLVSESPQGLVVQRFPAHGFTRKRLLTGFDTDTLAVSPNGRYAIGLDMSDNNNSLKVWDLKTSQRIANLGCDAEDRGYPHIAISSDGHYVAVSKSHKIYVWRVNFPS